MLTVVSALNSYRKAEIVRKMTLICTSRHDDTSKPLRAP